VNDLAARERIRGDLASTLLVEAAAGTGKTTELVARVIALVRQGARLDQILCVTFTDLAAGEMKLRLRSELETARSSALAEERKRFDDALARLELAPICTIHSFCADLLRERPVEARVDPVFEVAAGEEQDRIFSAAFESWFQQAAANASPGVQRLLRRKTKSGDTPPRELLRRAGMDLCEHRDFDGAWRHEPFDREPALQRILDLLREIAKLAEPGKPDEWNVRSSISELARFAAEQDRGGERNLDSLEADLHELSRRTLWKTRFGPMSKGPALARRDALEAELKATLQKCDAELAALLREELRPLCEEYERLKERAGALDFLDLLLRARDLVRDHHEVRAELQQNISHILVDEFQDTDPLQAELLLLLAAYDPAESNWRRVRAKPGKLFVVGDPKQSIYRFRRADIALYEDVKRQMLESGAQLLHLSTSFRAVPQIQQAVNAAFAPLMQEGTQAAYVPLDPDRSAIEGQPALIALPAPRIFGKKGDKVTKTAFDESYPQAVGAFVEWLVKESGWKVSERGKGLVPVAARHVCLLFKNMRVWNRDITRGYVDALEARRIPHVLIGGRSYHGREEVLALRAAAEAIEWPEDELAVFAALKGPLFALSDEQLLLYRKEHHHLRPWATAAQEDEVAKALRLLHRLHQQRNRRPIAQTFSLLLKETRAHAAFAIWPAGEQVLGNVLRLLESARKFEAAGARSFRAFVDRLAEEAERGDASEAPVVEEGTDGVRMMTVHKAKGLEFPVVILCSPTVNATWSEPTKFIDPGKRVWAMSLARCTPVELNEHKDELLARDLEESVRLTYVAATRARDLLVVPAQGVEELQGWLEPLSRAIYPRPTERRQPRAAPGCPDLGKETVLDRPEMSLTQAPVSPGLHSPQEGQHEVVWWGAGGEEPDNLGGLIQNDILVESGNSRATAEAHDAWQLERRAAIASGEKPSLEIETATARSLGQASPREVKTVSVEGRERGRPAGKRFGVLVHQTLAIARLQSTFEELLQLAKLQGRLLEAPEEEVEAAAKAVREALAHPLLREAARALELRREEPLLHALPDGTLLEGAVDLAFRDKDGWTVVDFKTDRNPAAHPQYAAQLALYCDAIEAATRLPARAVLLAV
jgi:ATP-dependent helicase/nuclease subunit A